MNFLFLPFHEIKKSAGLWIWLLFHLGIPILLGVSFFFALPLRVNTLFLEMLPGSGEHTEVFKADSILGEKNSRETVILAASPDFEIAKEGASSLYNEFKNYPGVENISYYFDQSVIGEFIEYLHKYRFVIASKNTMEMLETGNAGEIAMNALASAYGSFNLASLDKIDTDPFLLTDKRMEEFLSSAILSGGNLSVKDDVLAANVEGTWYVMLRLVLSPQAVSISKSNNLIDAIYLSADAAKNKTADLNFYFSGVPFHSYESSSSAQKEISIITIISFTLILLMFIFIFRSPIPVIFSVIDAAISIAIAAAAAFLVFREVHIMTFVFGTSLIGTCVDCSIHFFIYWKGNPALKNGFEIRSRILKSMIICLVSTAICFSAFLFAPFPILKQFAVFAITGLISSFLSAYCIFPILLVPSDEKRQIKLFTGKFYAAIKKISFSPAIRIIIGAFLVVLCIAVIIFSPYGIKIKNDVGSLYKMSDFLFESEMRCAKVIDHGSPYWYFIVSGRSCEETLQNEEKLLLRLEEEVKKGNLRSYMGTSVFVPSISRQDQIYEAMKALLPLAKSQYEFLGFPCEVAQLYNEEFTAARIHCFPEDAPAQAGISNLWIGDVNGNYYSCVMPIHATDDKIFRAISEEYSFVHFINKAEDISRDLDILTKTIIVFFLIAILIVFIIICLTYHWRDSLKICAVPVFMILAAVAVLSVNKIPLGFISIAALILVFSLGMDYIVYMSGRKIHNDKHISSLAIVLAFLTTLLSFGALSLSSFVPVHIFGLTISGGLSAAFIATMLLHGRKSDQ